jgi:hypothetical protein
MMKLSDPRIRNVTPAFRSQPGRIGNFLLTLGIMALSFFFYEMGLFGGVEGPLNPEQIGTTLARAGMTRVHLGAILLSVAFYALTWNWVLNAWYRRTGMRMTCTHAGGEDYASCGAPARREKSTERKTGKGRIYYLCSKGHRCSQADFHPIIKGAISNSVWPCCLLFSLAILFGF